MTETLERLAKLEQESKPLKKPRLLHRTCETGTPIYYPFTRETGIIRLLYCINGQALLIDKNGKTNFLTGGSVTILPQDDEYDLLLGRGSQNWITVHWEPESTYVPCTDEFEPCSFVLDDCSIALRALTSGLIDSNSGFSDLPNFMLAWINLIIHESKSCNRTFTLTPFLEGDAESLFDLIEAIKRSPETDWNLNAASRFAGYSPFHLSRIFRSSIGVGLPKFVESCRAEVAINRLLTGGDAINIVADECGFGSSQAMRSAIRDFTGFLPIELRGESGDTGE